MSRLGPKDVLSDEDLTFVLVDLSNWSVERDRLKLKRTLSFTDFVQAFAFMSEAALVAERLGHHPEWCNSWDRVDIALQTHTAGGITKADVKLAKEFDAIAVRFELVCGIDDGSCGGCR